MTQPAQFLVLTEAECRDMLARNHVGRLAFTRDGRVDIEPLGYVFSGDWLFLRSAWGTKLESLERNPFVAFEVDEARGPFDWASVVAHGTIYLLPADGAPIERREFERAVAKLRAVIPETLTAADPAPERQIVYGLHVDTLSGRMAQRGTAPRAAGRTRQPVRPAPKRKGARDEF